MFQSFILAGGKSSRMKRDKRFLKLGEKTLLDHSFLTLEKINSKKISVVLAEKPAKLLSYQVITDIYKNQGILSGIHSALANCNEKYALIIACDYPFISNELLKYLLAIAEKTNKDCIAPIQKDGIIQPLGAFYKTQKCLEKLTSILEHKEKTPSARNFLKSIDTKFVEFEEFEHLPNSKHFFFNVNTPEDFQKAKKLYRHPSRWQS